MKIEENWRRLERKSKNIYENHWKSLKIIENQRCKLAILKIFTWSRLIFIDSLRFSVDFLDFHKFSLVFVDSLWFSLDFRWFSVDVLWFSLILVNVHWFSVDVRWFSLIFGRCSLIFVNCRSMFADFRWVSLMFVDFRSNLLQSIEHLSTIYRKYVDMGCVWGGLHVYLGCVWGGSVTNQHIWLDIKPHLELGWR